MSERRASKDYHPYDGITLLCKNNCGYYGNSMQYEGYCSICYQKIKNSKPPSHLTSSLSFDDSTSLLKSSQSFSIDDRKHWNDNSNLIKFSSKTDKRKNSTFNKIFRRPSSTTTSINQNLVDTVTKVADKAVNLVDQSFQSTSFQFLFNNNEQSLNDFVTVLNKLLKPSNVSVINPSAILLSNTGRHKPNQDDLLNDFEDLFKQNFSQLYQDLMKQMKNFIDRFKDFAYRQKDELNTKQAEMVQEFFRKIYKYITTSGSIKNYLEKLNSDEIDDEGEKFYEGIMIMVESYINNQVYDLVFPSLMTEFEEKDIDLQKKIRKFHWITSEMIGTCIDENSVFYRDSYEEAINNIVEVDSKRTSYEKMLCITNCSKNLFNAINIASNIKTSVQLVEVETKTKNLASADDFLPALIYIVLKANPTMLYSNINFVTRFAFEKRILQGEHAYHFCSLNAVIAHIENLDAHHLNMDQELFDSYSNGIELDNIGNIQKMIETNLKVLSELKDKQKLIKQETSKLQTDIKLFRDLMNVKFESCVRTNGVQNVLDDNRDLISFNESSSGVLQPSSVG